MSTPFWIFMAALGAILLWALLSWRQVAHRMAAHAAAEGALNNRMLEFQERVRNRNARILAERAAEPEEKATGEGFKWNAEWLHEPDFEKPTVRYASQAEAQVAVAVRTSRKRKFNAASLALRSKRFPMLRKMLDDETDLEFLARRIGMTPEQLRELMARGRDESFEAPEPNLAKTRWW